METAIFGAGSMGTALGAYISNAGVVVDMITRNKAHVEALKKTGAKIGGTVSLSTAPFDGKDGRGLAMLPAEMKKNYDIIILLTKQLENAAIAELLKNSLSPGGVVCTLQNGIPEFGLEKMFGPERVLGAMTAWGAEKTSPGSVAITSEPGNWSFALGSLSGKAHPRMDDVRRLLEKMCTVETPQNYIGARWSKLLINAAFSGMSAVTGCNFGQVAADKRMRTCALYVIKECIDVCRAAGIHIEPVQGKDIVRLLYFKNALGKLKASIILPIAIKKHRLIKSSMLGDLDRGRPCEIDTINGVVSDFGKTYNTSTPVNDRVIEIVHSIERGERKYDPQNVGLFAKLW